MAIAGVAHAIKPRTPKGAFLNQPFTDFSDPENARAIRHALDQVSMHLGSEYPLIIGGKRLKTAERIRSINPARPAQVVGVHQKAGAAQVDAAMNAALHAFDSWSKTPVEDRVSLLLGAADIIRTRKFEFMAWLVYEVGKNWAEADADVVETIDFLEFYAREALRLAAAALPIQYPGERNELLY
ncbi:MAG: aldehyde dehydrogenase family protein, partial [Terracidiphilus sp.]